MAFRAVRYPYLRLVHAGIFSHHRLEDKRDYGAVCSSYVRAMIVTLASAVSSV